MDGLNKAADSSAYSPENKAPMSSWRLRESGCWVKTWGWTFSVVVQQQAFDVKVAGVEIRAHGLQFGGDLFFRQGEGALPMIGDDAADCPE